MKRKTRTNVAMAAVVGAALALGTTGCDDEVAAELVALTGTYFGDVVAVSTTACLLHAVGVEGDGDAHEHEGEEDDHTHATAPLHDHEH